MATIKEQVDEQIAIITAARECIEELRAECKHPDLRKKWDYMGDGWVECPDCGFKEDI